MIAGGTCTLHYTNPKAVFASTIACGDYEAPTQSPPTGIHQHVHTHLCGAGCLTYLRPCLHYGMLLGPRQAHQARWAKRGWHSPQAPPPAAAYTPQEPPSRRRSRPQAACASEPPAAAHTPEPGASRGKHGTAAGGGGCDAAAPACCWVRCCRGRG